MEFNGFSFCKENENEMKEDIQVEEDVVEMNHEGHEYERQLEIQRFSDHDTKLKSLSFAKQSDKKDPLNYVNPRVSSVML
jgi:hypothetical protein